MTIIGFILVVCIIGIVLWLVTTYLPLDPRIKQFLVAAVIILLVLWLIQLIGFLDAPIPRIR